jgi:hypothetical protein
VESSCGKRRVLARWASDCASCSKVLNRRLGALLAEAEAEADAEVEDVMAAAGTLAPRVLGDMPEMATESNASRSEDRGVVSTGKGFILTNI